MDVTNGPRTPRKRVTHSLLLTKQYVGAVEKVRYLFLDRSMRVAVCGQERLLYVRLTVLYFGLFGRLGTIGRREITNMCVLLSQFRREDCCRFRAKPLGHEISLADDQARFGFFTCNVYPPSA